MKVVANSPPREFRVGDPREPVTMRDCGRVALAADEQVTFVTETGGEYDVARKAWGFYATPSVNGRLATFGLRAALVRSAAGRCYVLLRENGHEEAFASYLARENMSVLAWLDDPRLPAALSGLEAS